MKAIILAAGKGTRLNGVDLKPKCLFEVGGRTLLQWQISALAEAQISEIVLVLGFEAERIVRLCAAAEELKGSSPLTQLEIATGDGSVFVVREGKTTIAATTAPAPTVGLVFYDLKSALRSVNAKPKPKPRTAAAKKPAAKKPPVKKQAAPRRKKPDAS